MFPNAVAVLCNMCTRDFSSLLSLKVDILPLRQFDCCPSSCPGAHLNGFKQHCSQIAPSLPLYFPTIPPFTSAPPSR